MGPGSSSGPALQDSYATGTTSSLTDSSPKVIPLSRPFAGPTVPNRENLVGDFDPPAYLDDMIAEGEASGPSPIGESHVAYTNEQVHAGVEALLGSPTEDSIKFLATFNISSYPLHLLKPAKQASHHSLVNNSLPDGIVKDLELYVAFLEIRLYGREFELQIPVVEED